MEIESKSKTSFIIVVVVAVVVLIIYVGWVGSGAPVADNATKTVAAPPPGSGAISFTSDASKNLTPEQITQKKAEILKMASTGKILTAEQKKTILSLIIGEQIKRYNFTDAERQKVIDALNKN